MKSKVNVVSFFSCIQLLFPCSSEVQKVGVAGAAEDSR